MPIRPENRGRYPADWPEISAAIKWGRAEGRCECRGLCGRPSGHLASDSRCRNWHGWPIWDNPGRLVVLTTAHLNHTPEDCRPENLRALCQGCHLHYDLDHHRETRQRVHTAALEALMYPLFHLNHPTNTENRP
jgi:hypothetical protein